MSTFKAIVIALFIAICHTMVFGDTKNEPQTENLTVSQNHQAALSLNDQDQESEQGIKSKLTNFECKNNKGSFKSILDMHNWYTRELQTMTSALPGQQKSLQLLSVTSKIKTDSVIERPATHKIRLGVDFSLPLRTTNFHFGKNIYSWDKWDIYGIGIIGGGSLTTPVFQYTDQLTSQTVDDRVESNIGLGAEIGRDIGKDFYAYVGTNICNVSLKNTSNGSNINPYIGIRYFSPLKTPFYHLTADFKIGKPYWSGFQAVSGDHGPYVSGGFTLVSRKPFGKAEPPRTAPLETSLIYSPAMSTISAKIAYPIRIYEQLSIAASINLGTDARTFQRNQKEISSIYGGGLDLRLYGDEMDRILNPFISYNYYFMEYDESGANIGEGHNVHVGNRFSLGKKFYLDVFTGPSFGDRSVRIISSQNRISDPTTWDIGAGISYSIGIEKPKKEAQLSEAIGSYVAYCGKSEELNDLPRGKFDTVSQAELTEQLEIAQKQIDSGEKNVKVKLEEERIYAIFDDCKGNYIEFGDLTNIKFFQYDLGNVLDASQIAKTYFNDLHEEGKSLKLLLALFDKRTTRTDLIQNNQMYLHFINIEKGKCFGYRLDENGLHQPEIRDFAQLNINDPKEPIFYGKYDQYVKSLSWLDQTKLPAFGLKTFPGDLLTDIILQKIKKSINQTLSQNYLSAPTLGPIRKFNLKDYRLAYAIYPEETVKNVVKACGRKGFGLSIMFRLDLNENQESDSLVGKFMSKEIAEHSYPSTPIYGTVEENSFLFSDPNDAAFFSNTGIELINLENSTTTTVNIESRGDQIVIQPFNMGWANFSQFQLSNLRVELENRRLSHASKIKITGYTDRTPLTKGSLYSSQKKLAQARADFIKNILVNNFGILSDIISTEGFGIHPDAKPYEKGTDGDPKSRCVIIELE